MDRAKFLRSLPFLRRLPPGAWDVCCRENESDSTSTGETTLGGGTPLKDSATGLLEGATFAVSIEPRWMAATDFGDAPKSGNVGVNITAATGNGRRKRDRGDEQFPDPDDGRSVGVAYFASAPSEESSSAGNADSETNSMDRSDRDENTAALLELNADCAMSSFELAIVKLPMSAMGGDGSVSSSQNGAVATPAITPQGGRLTTDEVKDAMLFRFGHHFVFQCDSRYIEKVSLTAKVSSSERKDGSSNEKAEERSPPAKRKKDIDNSSVATKPATKPGLPPPPSLPPSLAIHFSSCVMRVFPIDSEKTEQTKIWETLATRPESSESLLENAKTLIEQRLGVYGDRMWEMAPSGSADSFIKWPHLDDLQTCFHLNNAEYVSMEDWPCCLSRKSKRVQYETPRSPEKSSSTSKPSSGSALEQGQKEPAVSLFDDTQSTKGDDNQNKSQELLPNGSERCQKAPIRSQSQSNVRNSPRRQRDQKLSQSEDSFDKSIHISRGRKTTEFQSNSDNSPGVAKELGPEVEKSGRRRGGDGAGRSQSSVQSQSSPKIHESAMKQAGHVSVQLPEGNVNSKADEQQYGKIVSKYRQFEDSSLQMDAAVQNKSSRAGMSQCAQSLSESYMTMEEFKTATENCEADIQWVTVEMEQSLTGLRSKRGDDADDVDPTRIEELMRRRKKAVAAKVALLLIPKR
mmetsp:Transcript_37784/g.85019  ORF Transcript_37784/g.85019 Transcript_37784/m.85019 type:complete len:688 (-) Transcript_37784:121-2184(-)